MSPSRFPVSSAIAPASNAIAPAVNTPAPASIIWLHRFCRVLAAATLLLVAAGGMVTSTNSGLSVPDWPTSYGYGMFSFPLDKMVGGIFYEHGHRLIASTVGFLTIILAVWIWRVDSRAWMRRLGWIALAAVILQGLLGGLTVRFLLPAPISIGHAGLAQLFFALVVSITLFTSRGWLAPTVAPINDDVLRRRLITMTGAVYIQILLGATMRHIGAGLAIPDFPLVFGGILPPSWTAGIAVHYLHRLGALVVVTLVAHNASRILRNRDRFPELVRPAILLIVAGVAQVTLGAFVIWTGKQEVVNTLHVATGAVVFTTSVVVTLRAHRILFGAPFHAV